MNTSIAVCREMDGLVPEEIKRNIPYEDSSVGRTEVPSGLLVLIRR